MNSRLPSRLCTQRGNALVEFALVLPLLLLIFAGIVDFGFLFQRYEVITNAAREGARIGVLPGYEAADVQQRVLDYVQEGLNMSAGDAAAALGGTPDVEMVMLGAATGAPFLATQVTVRFTYNYLIIGPIVNLATGGGWAASITLNARCTMRREIVGS
jgi:Flp pilus assembly protein TadG